MKFVVDSSVALSWCFRDELSAATEELLASLRPGDLIVPALWHLEMTNILSLALRKQRLSEQELPGLLQMFKDLNPLTDDTLFTVGSPSLLPLMQEFSLTAYDATYLELALRRDLPLATFDLQLKSAAHKSHVRLVI